MVSGILKNIFTSDTEKDIENRIKQMMSLVVESGNALDESVRCIISGDSDALEQSVSKVISIEKDLDDLRRKTEDALYSGSTITSNKAEKIDLLEALDDIADSAEHAARMLNIKKINLDKNLTSDLENISSSTKKSIIALSHAINALYTDFREVRKYDDIAEEERNNARMYQSRIMRTLFSLNCDIKDIILLKTIIERIVLTADASEIASDKLNYMAHKYSP